eukprot:5869930-Prymnesium_polylepis.1
MQRRQRSVSQSNGAIDCYVTVQASRRRLTEPASWGDGPLRNSQRFECCSTARAPFQPNCQRFEADSERSHVTRSSACDFQSDQSDD